MAISDIVKATIKASGYTPDANASGGRCYEFRDALIVALKRAGYKKVYATDSRDWLRRLAKRMRQPVGYAEANNIEENNHAWVVCNGKHYDSLTPGGAKRAGQLKYFVDSLRDYHWPDAEQIAYWKSKGIRYDTKNDKLLETASRVFAELAADAKQRRAAVDWPTVPPFPKMTDFLRNAVFNLHPDIDTTEIENELTEEMVPVSKLRRTQDRLNSREHNERNSKYRDYGRLRAAFPHHHDLPVVLEVDGLYVIQDGHNRLTAEFLKGKKKVRVYVYHVTNADYEAWKDLAS